jgi:alanine dehydrogenase
MGDDQGVLILSRQEVERLINLDALVLAVAEAMADLSGGSASMPPRVAARVEEHQALLAAMPGYVPSRSALTSKLVSLFPENAGTDLPTHQAVIVSFDSHTGEPIALMDGTYITATRTAAGSALSAKLLAREDAEVMALLGTGIQARAHARALPRVREVGEIRVAGRDASKAEQLARELAKELGLVVRAVDSYADALDGADIACATTHALEPVVRGEWLSPGTHVTSVGYNPAGRELDDATVASALVVVESRDAALAPIPAGSNDLTQPIRDGVITADHVHAEIGELISGVRPGRADDEQITLYKSVGVAVQDSAAAALVLEAAREQGLGREVEL